MNIFATLFHKKPAQPLRSVVAYRTESLAAQRRRNDKRLELEVLKQLVGNDAWKAAVERGKTVKFETEAERFARIEPLAFAGMRMTKLGKGAL